MKIFRGMIVMKCFFLFIVVVGYFYKFFYLFDEKKVICEIFFYDLKVLILRLFVVL